MALDGLSNQSVGIYRTKDSSEQNERLAAKSTKDAENRVDATALVDKTDKDGSNKNKHTNTRDAILSKAKELIDNENEEEVLKLYLAEDDSTVELEYTIKFNPETKMIDVNNAKDGKIIESISPEELIKVLYKAKNISGILIDKKI